MLSFLEDFFWGIPYNYFHLTHYLFLFSGMFFSSNSLGVFTVSDNSISELDNQSFHGLHLTELSLQNNPLLSQLRRLVFDGAAVERMSLDRCNLTTIRSDHRGRGVKGREMEGRENDKEGEWSRA